MSNLLQKKNPKYDYSSDVLDIVHAMAVDKNKINIVGSMSHKSTLYPNDYDCFEKITVNTNIVQKLKHIIQTLLKMKNTYICDIKFGEHDGDAIRWEPSDILKGQKQINVNTTVKLLDAVKQNKMNKIDVISLVNNSIFKDFSCVYMTNNINNFDASIARDIAENYHENNYFKTCKRLFSYYKSTDKHIAMKLQDLFNSNIGLLYNVYSDTGTILYLMDNFHNVPFERVENEIDNFKNRMSHVYKINKFLQKQPKINAIINNAEKKGHTVASLTQLQNILNEIIQKETYKFMQNNGIIAILRKIL